MSVNLSKQTADLSALIGQLKKRCLEAEARVSDLQGQIERQQARIGELMAEKETLEQKYQNLLTGLTATDQHPERIDQLKEFYLGLVSELDTCIAMLQNG